MRLRIVIALFFVLLVLTGCSLKERRMEQIRSRYPQWDPATTERVASRKVEPGMTREMVEVALGRPETITLEGDEEKWTYVVLVTVSMGAISKRPVYFVYFMDGKVVRTEGDWSKLGYWYY